MGVSDINMSTVTDVSYKRIFLGVILHIETYIHVCLLEQTLFVYISGLNVAA